MNKGWYAFDLDGTLAEYTDWMGVDVIGDPIPSMVNKVKEMLAEGKDVRIFTARVFPIGTNLGYLYQLGYNDEQAAQRLTEAGKAYAVIQQWCKNHIGKVLPITCIKDFSMIELWDDRAVQVYPNTGLRADGN